MNPVVVAALFVALSFATGCASSDGDAGDAGDSAASTEQSAEPPTAAAQPADDGRASPEASLTVADIDRWQRGMEAEMVAVRAAGAFPPEVIVALRPRAVELRRQEMALVGERLRAAGMAR